MKIAVISDLHLGFRQYGSHEREQDFYNQLFKVCREINKHNPEMLIVAGDLFDKPNPSPEAISVYRNSIGNLSVDIICTIKGNHTMLLRDGHYSIDDFFGTDEFEGYYYLDDKSMNVRDFAFDSQSDGDFKKYVKEKVQIDGITYRGNSDLDEFIEVQKKMAADDVEEGTYRILVVHQSFKEFCGFVGEKLSIKDIDYSPYNVIICGHIHSRMDVQLSNGTWFIQPGSIERMNTTEALDEDKNGKGFYLIDTEKDSIEFHKVECDRKFFLGSIKISSKEDLEKHFEELEKKVSKLKIAPIISYNYYNNIGNIALLRENINTTKNNILLNKSNIYDETEEDISVEITDTELPTVLEGIKIYGEKSGLKDKEIDLAIELHKVLSKGTDDGKELVDNYYRENKKEFVSKKTYDKELEEIIEYFEK